MSAQGTTVIFSGVIRAHGRQITCLISAIKNHQSRGAQLTDYRIRHVSESLDDGDYELMVADVVMRVRLRGGNWLMESD